MEYNRLLPAKVNDYLDTGYGSCCLKNIESAKIMAEALEFFDGERYILHRYVVMPNHVHVLVELTGGYDLSEICKSWKGFSARCINKLLDQSGQFWHHESWDRMIRNERHYETVVKYIERNIRCGGVLWR